MLPLWLLLITVLTPLLLSYIKPIFNSRLAIVGLPLFALGVAVMLADAKTGYFLSLKMVALSVIGILFLHPGFSRCDNRATAAFINEKANDGDAVIFTSLSRLPIDFYLDQIPTRKHLVETTFPAEIDLHPGYEGRITDPNRETDLENEARDLVDRLERSAPQQAIRHVFVLRGFHTQIDAILDQKLRERLKFKGLVLKCDEASQYFKEIVLYEKDSTQ